MPWKVLGQKWHFARKGFPPGKTNPVGSRSAGRIVRAARRGRARADSSCGTISRSCTCSCAVKAILGPPSTRSAFDAVYLQLTGPKNRFALGQLTEFGSDRNLDTTSSHFDRIHICFHSLADLSNGDLPALLREHFAAVAAANSQSPTKTIFAKSPRLQKAVS